MPNPRRDDALPERMSELIADCSDIPDSLCAESAVPLARSAEPWTVNEVCLAQVDDLEAYI
ncbi:MAG: hypothetical protein GEU98_13005 [Pseudonocardiaceae bacterium]|nr:hypothetical protein [Pseudonocardiaceae bacterium]